jgi:hypothetical protein
MEHIGRATLPGVSLAVFALVVTIWVLLLVPVARRGRAELAAEASDGSRLTSGGARPWTTGDLPHDPDLDDEDEELAELELAAAAAAAHRARRRSSRRRVALRRRRVLLLLVAATAAGSRAWAVLGGRWWVAAATAGLLLAGYLLVLAGRGGSRSRAGAGSWGGPVAPSTE